MLETKIRDMKIAEEANGIYIVVLVHSYTVVLLGCSSSMKQLTHLKTLSAFGFSFKKSLNLRQKEMETFMKYAGKEMSSSVIHPMRREERGRKKRKKKAFLAKEVQLVHWVQKHAEQ